MDGQTLKDIDLTESNARWPHPWHLVHRASLHKELKRVATSEDRSGLPVKLFPHNRVVLVDAGQGVALENGNKIEADVIVGADGIFVGHGCHSSSL
jgi:2-polyprenyl-6-methoxyphenol hydroxylase-like FAD-dependent oxidoreductase